MAYRPGAIGSGLLSYRVNGVDQMGAVMDLRTAVGPASYTQGTGIAVDLSSVFTTLLRVKVTRAYVTATKAADTRDWFVHEAGTDLFSNRKFRLLAYVGATPAGTNSAPALTMDSYTPTGTNGAPGVTTDANVLSASGSVSINGNVVQAPSGVSTDSNVVNASGAVSNASATNLATPCIATCNGNHVTGGITNGIVGSGAGKVANVVTAAGVTTASVISTGAIAKVTAVLTVAAPSFTGNAATLTGTVAAPVFTGTAESVLAQVPATTNLSAITVEYEAVGIP